MDRVYIKDLKVSEEEVLLKGWVHKIRDLAHVTFIMLRDKSGIIQLVCEKEQVKGLRLENSIEVIGVVKKSDKAIKGMEVEVLDEVFFKKAYSNIALNNALNKSNVRDIDKGLITELVYGTLKHKYTIDEIIKAITGRNIRDIDKFSINIIL